MIILITGCTVQEKIYFAAPTGAAPTEFHMKSPGFWISRHPVPDQVVLDPPAIATLNLKIQNQLKLTEDIFSLPITYSGSNLKKTLDSSLSELKSKDFYVSSGRHAKDLFFEDIRRRMSFESIPSQVPVQYGLIVHYTDQRFYPLESGLYALAGDIDFDELQNSSLDVGTPVAVLHESRDGQWVYVISSLSSGWIKKNDVAVGDLKTVKDYVQNSFVIVTAAKADLFWNDSLIDYDDYARMGSRFPLENSEELKTTTEKIYRITIPTRNTDGTLSLKKSFIKADDVHQGYLTYTPRTIIEQAFKLLNAPYGWGGMYGEQDCSAFLDEIFATVGIYLPRNSSAQAQAGNQLAKFNDKTTDGQKLNALKNQAIGGITLLPLKGHIMLYLGTIDNRAYAIHATWGYRERIWFHDRVRLLNRVVVSDLSLGEGSHKNSLLKRLISLTKISQ